MFRKRTQLFAEPYWACHTPVVYWGYATRGRSYKERRDNVLESSRAPLATAEHHTRAASHHTEAAKHHESGDHEKAAHHAHTARRSFTPCQAP